MFNLAAYANLLVGQFRQAGGRIERREFRTAGELGELPQKGHQLHGLRRPRAARRRERRAGARPDRLADSPA